jgi:hypothetical protein
MMATVSLERAVDKDFAGPAQDCRAQAFENIGLHSFRINLNKRHDGFAMKRMLLGTHETALTISSSSRKASLAAPRL